MQHTLSAIAQILIAVAIVVMAVVMYLYMPKVEQFVENTARHECAQDYRLNFTDDNTTVSRPIDDLYAKCLTEKNIQ